VELPRRYSLATQAAASIRQSIAQGAWTEFLPNERSLALQLQISRPTLRAAIDILRHDGVVEVVSRQGTKILSPGRKNRPENPTTVVLLTGKPLHQHGASVLSFVGNLQTTLTSSGFQLVIVDDPQLSKGHPQKFLEKVTAQHQAVCYLLSSVSEAVQVYFSRVSLPVMIFGSRFPGVKLPSCDWNYEAIGRHAAGVFVGKGHRRLCLVRPLVMKKGDLEGEEGFRRIAQKRHEGALSVISHGGRASALFHKVQKVFAAEDRPTGIFVLDPYDCVTVLFALQSLGLKVPEQVSIISLDWATVFNAIPYRIAFYSDHSRLAEKSAKLVLKLALNHVVPPNENLIMADFNAGETVAALK
jgi:DNA-binding LacI/PurR family transcriptional regulator